MQYSVKLKNAMAEIKAILKKNDIAGIVVLHTPGFSEYLNFLDTDYSCADLKLKGLQFQLSAAGMGNERANQIASDTYNMITHFSHHLTTHSNLYNDAHKMLKAKWNGSEYPGGHTSHIEQNN